MENPVTEKMVTATCARCRNVIDVTGLDPGDSITCPYCSHQFPITRQFGNFLLERQLGAGGMGAVYLGKDVTLNRQVAVKVLKPELVSDHKFLATFLREAEITASLNHPNIVQVYAFGQHEGVYYLVVEYISGGTLDDKIVNVGRITELEGIEIGLAVARGLECALRRGLVHRDIKPGNILFNASNTPKVVDFGLSLSPETMDHFDGEIWGTPYYVAPEKLERLPEDFRSDLYSLGATLFHAISGRPPYEGEDPNDVAMKHLSGSVVSLKAFVPDISDQTSYAVSKAMARYPDDRYESYAAFIAQLEDAKRRITDPHFREKQHQDVAILETESSAKYNLWLMIGLVAIVAILIGLLAWKGSSLFTQDDNKHVAELNDYNPTGRRGSTRQVTPNIAPKVVQPTPPPAPPPIVQPTPLPAPPPIVQPTPLPAPPPVVQPTPLPAPPPIVQPTPPPAPAPVVQSTTAPGAIPLGKTINLQAQANGLWVSADTNGTSPLIANHPNPGIGESFVVVDESAAYGPGYVALRSLTNGFGSNEYVTAANSFTALIANGTTVGPTQVFYWQSHGNGSISLRSYANGRWVSAENAGLAPLIANRIKPAKSETFNLRIK